MNQYTGPVVIVLEDGTEVETAGQLWDDSHSGLASWSGVVTSDDLAALNRVHNAAKIQVRLPGGSEADALVDNLDVSVRDGRVRPPRLSIRSNGSAAPF